MAYLWGSPSWTLCSTYSIQPKKYCTKTLNPNLTKDKRQLRLSPLPPLQRGHYLLMLETWTVSRTGRKIKILSLHCRQNPSLRQGCHYPECILYYDLSLQWIVTHLPINSLIPSQCQKESPSERLLTSPARAGSWPRAPCSSSRRRGRTPPCSPPWTPSGTRSAAPPPPASC